MKIFLLISFIVSSLLTANAQVTNGLIAYYPFNGNAKDVSGNKHNGTVVNATLTTDHFGNANSAYYFNGTNAIIDIPDHTDFHMSNFTISAWLNITQSAQSFVSKAFGNSYFNSFDMAYENFLEGVFTDGGSQKIYLSATSLPSTWVYCTMSFNDANNELKFYRNDTLVSILATNLAVAYDNSLVTIGGEYNNGVLAYLTSGSVDEVRIYNRVLSSAEIDTLYRDGCVKPKGLKATEITSTSAKLTWNAVPGALAYRLTTRQKGKSNTRTTDIAATSKSINNLKSDKVYEWKVQSICSYSPLIMSDTAKGKDFTTAASIINAGSNKQSLQINNQFNAALYPNPAKNNVYLNVSGNNKPVSIIITDLSGKILWKKDNVVDRSIAIPLQNFTNGTYLVKVNNGEQTKTLKLVKAE